MSYALALVGFVLLALLVEVDASGSAIVRGQRPAAVASQSGPQLLSLRYTRVRPGGALRSYWALALRARDPAGQIVAVYFQRVQPPGGGGGIADGGCGLGGQRNGHTQTTTIPISKLSPGRYRYRVTVEAAACVPGGTRGLRATRVFAFRVR